MPDPSYYSRLARLSIIVTLLPSTMGAGWLFGYYLVDRNFGTFPWGSLVATFIGAAAGFYEIFRLVLADQKKDP